MVLLHFLSQANLKHSQLLSLWHNLFLLLFYHFHCIQDPNKILVDLDYHDIYNNQNRWALRQDAISQLVQCYIHFFEVLLEMSKDYCQKPLLYNFYYNHECGYRFLLELMRDLAHKLNLWQMYFLILHLLLQFYQYLG